VGVSGLPRVRFENDLGALAGESQASRDDGAVIEAVGRALDPTIWMTTSLEDARALGEHMRARPAVFGAALSMADVLPQDPTESARILALMHTDLQTLRGFDASLTGAQRALLERGLALTEAQPWGPQDVPEFWRSRLRAKDGERWLVYGWGKAALTTEQAAVAWAGHVNDASAVTQGQARVLDEGRVIARMFGLMRQNVWPMLGAALGGVLLMLLVFRARRGWQSVWTTAAALAAGMCVTLGLMGWMGWPLQFYNMAALPILLGVGIDNALHLQHGRDERGAGQTHLVLRHQGYAGLLAAATSTMGFGALCIAAHPGVASLGWLAVLGMSCTTFFTMAVLPAWWVWRDNPPLADRDRAERDR
jgi:predicted exporter